MTGAECIPALKALSDGNLLRILRLLSKSPLSVGEISGELELADYNVSKHLKILTKAGLLECRKEGKERHYAIPGKFHGAPNTCDGVLDLGCCTFRFDHLPK